MQKLTDAFGRVFSYLRVSVTERCNFRCTYCLPDGYHNPRLRSQAELTPEEIRRLATAFSEMGFSKIRITGGEPTVRTDILSILENISNVDAIKTLALSTNGFRLKKMAKQLHSAGVNALNVSVDSLDPDRYHKITGHDRLSEILEGIDCALSEGFSSIKVNAVLLQDFNACEVEAFIEWARTRPITVRFIELMETGDNKLFFTKQHASALAIQSQLEADGWKHRLKKKTDGPAEELIHPDSLGAVGFIRPYGKNFCDNCNRLRISSHGQLRLCLFGNSKTSLRHLLEADSQKQEVKEFVSDLIMQKTSSHLLAQNNTGQTTNLSIIGG